MPQAALLSRTQLQDVVRGTAPRTSPPSRIQTGLLELDRLFGGGLPCGVITELVGAPSSGRTTLAYAAMVAVTAAGGLAACIDLPNAFDPEHANAAGIVLARVLWVRPRDHYGAFRAAEQVVGAGGFSLVLVDLDVFSTSRTKISTGAWFRLARAAEQSRSAVMILSGRRAEGAFPTVCIESERRRGGFDGDRSSGLFDGIFSAVHLRKYKLGSPVAVPIALFAAVSA